MFLQKADSVTANSRVPSRFPRLIIEVLHQSPGKQFLELRERLNRSQPRLTTRGIASGPRAVSVFSPDITICSTLLPESNDTQELDKEEATFPEINKS
ncbi:hypothetical protein KGM_202478 [Danaus plexippus plexippus]|uniref:Uncharacterized protein n=1 Tax=Danaus plexippus plexippus TaxID=278856 RepID=A0A212EXT0_DANPL|nr:hypothetical protein KGM_202478 [Danaus plexippus plexippus]